MKRLLGLYPRAWRQRYGDEIARLLDDLRPLTLGARVAIGLDLLRGAGEAYMTTEGPPAVTSPRGRPLLRATLVALVVWLGVSVLIVLSNVVFPSRIDDDGPWVALGYVSVFLALAITGVLAARTGRGAWAVAAAGALAGVLIGVLTVGTFLVVDNVFLDIVAQQQTKIDGFAHSGATSMRAYINANLIGPGVVLPVFFGVAGAGFASFAGFLTRRPGEAAGVRRAPSSA